MTPGKALSKEEMRRVAEAIADRVLQTNRAAAPPAKAPPAPPPKPSPFAKKKAAATGAPVAGEGAAAAAQRAKPLPPTPPRATPLPGPAAQRTKPLPPTPPRATPLPGPAAQRTKPLPPTPPRATPLPGPAAQRTKPLPPTPPRAKPLPPTPPRATPPPEKEATAEVDVRIPTLAEVDEYKTIIWTDRDTLQRRTVAIAAFRGSVALVKEAGSGLSEVSEKLAGQVKKALDDGEKTERTFNLLLRIRDAVINPSGVDPDRLGEAARDVFARIDTAHSELSQMGAESASVCTEATASLAQLLRTPDEVIDKLLPPPDEDEEDFANLGATQKVTVAVRFCKKQDRQLAIYPAEPTIDACKSGIKSLITLLTNAATPKT